MKAKRRVTKMIAALLIMVIGVGFYTPVHAEQIGGVENEILPMYENIVNETVALSISDGTAKCNAYVTCRNSSNITITMTLQKASGSSWNAVKTWSGNDSAVKYFYLSKTRAVTSGKYRVKAVFKVGSETVTKYSSIKTY